MVFEARPGASDKRGFNPRPSLRRKTPFIKHRIGAEKILSDPVREQAPEYIYDSDITNPKIINLFSQSNKLNLTVGWSSISTVNVRADYLGIEGWVLKNINLTIDLTKKGKNGLDVGSEQANTWYAIWVIYNEVTNETAGLFSLSQTAPTMPPDFTAKRRVNWVFNDSISNILGFYNHQNWQFWNQRITLLNTATPATIFTDIDASIAMPPTARLIQVYASIHSDTSQTSTLSIRRNGSGETIGDCLMIFIGPVATAFAAYIGGSILIPTDENQIFEYKASAGAENVKIYATGFFNLEE